ncbi:TauD/TfdA dioxygenase family protein [Sphingobium sp. LMC3-1-1.1]|uniref:TauD/TfdA dioxygenase family protein n=1 Tax=unclassified Sphingobium TaxID=2611147 RepID=UPI00343150C2
MNGGVEMQDRTNQDLVLEPLPGAFGVRAVGIDLNHADDALLRGLADALFQNRILVVPGQAMSNDQYVAFGKRWGRPVLLVSRSNRHGEHPEMIVQSNSGSVPAFMRNVASHWHCDSSYEDEVATVTMLLGVKAPAEGGETLFADLVAAYATLPKDMRDRIDGLRVHHGVSAAQPGKDETIIRPQDLPEDMQRHVDIPAPVLHPLVRTHPVTGVKALYGLGGSAFAVEGMDEAEGLALLDDLKGHASAPIFVQDYKLMPGDVLLWDNLSVMHRATPIEYSDAPDKARLNYRISVKGLPDFLSVPENQLMEPASK